MSRLVKGLLWGFAFEAAAIAILWTAIQLEGSRWAALFGLAAIPLLLVRFPEKQRSRR